MDRQTVGKRYYPEGSSWKFRDSTPESYSILFLVLYPQRIFNYPNAPFFLEVGPFPQHLVLKVVSEYIFLGHVKEYIMRVNRP